MTETDSISPQGNRLRWVAFAVALAIIAVVIGQAAFVRDISWMRVWIEINMAGVYLDSYTVTLLVAAGSLIAWKREYAIALILACFGLTFGVLMTIEAHLSNSVYTRIPPPMLRALTQPSNYCALIYLALLLVQRLRGRWDYFRIAACLGCFVHLAFHIIATALSWMSHNAWIPPVRAVFEIAYFALASYVAWCLAFRQKTVSDPQTPPTTTT